MLNQLILLIYVQLTQQVEQFMLNKSLVKQSSLTLMEYLKDKLSMIWNNKI